MNNFERYTILVAMAFFFSFMVLGLVGVHQSQKKKNDYLQAMVVDQLNQKIATVREDRRNCFRGDALREHVNKQSREQGMIRFLTANMDSGEHVEIYLNGQPDGNGAFFAIKTDSSGSVPKGCVIARGVNMKMALPSPAAGDEVQIRAPVKASAMPESSEETSEDSSETAE
jgi:hypothetical protein